MEQRVLVDPGTPRQNPTTSYWQDPPSEIADLRTTAALPEAADYVVIGSGISGCCIAYNLLSKTPTARIVLLEARRTASGATGRNGGHTKAASYRSFLDHERELGLSEAVKIARMEHDNIVATHAFARRHGIDCCSTECNTVDVIYSQNQLALASRSIDRIRQTMGKEPAATYTIWNAVECREKFLTPHALGAIEYYAGSLSAYAFTIGVLKLALAKGLNLQTNTPAKKISPCSTDGKKMWTVETSRGSILAPKVILATNGYTAHLLPQMAGLVVPLQGQVVAQRPGSHLPQTGLDHTYSFIQESGYEYMITRPPGSSNEGDIVIGGGIWRLPNDGASRYGESDDTSLDPTITSYLRQCTADYFGFNWGQDHRSGRIKKEWSGIMGTSADGLPYVGEMPEMPGLWLSVSFNGHGMVWCFKAAQALVGMMIGNEAERKSINDWFPQSACMTKQRMKTTFVGRRDLRGPGEAAFANSGKL